MIKDQKKSFSLDDPITWDNWHKHINWLNVLFIVIIPISGCIAAFSTPLCWQTAVWALIYYPATMLGITAGYHRLWAHTSYTATVPLQICLAALGAGAVQGSIRWWARDHRAHHRYTDTDKDPYSVSKGLLYAHFGWMIMRQDPKRIGRTDISDLNDDPIVVWQHRNYIPVAFTMALVFPMVMAGIGWGDWVGGLVYAGIIRFFATQQATFCVNSLAHWLGDQPFDDRNSPRNHIITALVTLGEGYHNFHHEFPSDYRNAIAWHEYDPTKWFIWLCKKVGLAGNLKRFRANEIDKGRLQQLQKKLDLRMAAQEPNGRLKQRLEKQQAKLDKAYARLDWGIPLEDLPVWEWQDYVRRADEDEARTLVAIAGVVHDVSDFVRDHPGGKAMIRSGNGKDATAMFNGGVYRHSNAAHNLLSTMRVAIIRGGMEVEAWKCERKQATMEVETIAADECVL